MYNNNKLTLYEVTDFLGEPTKQSGIQFYFQCPDCLDKGKDNLTFNSAKGLLKSFCCDSGYRIFGEIIKKRNLSARSYHQKIQEPQPQQKPVITEETHAEYLVYRDMCKEELYNNQKRLNYLRHSRGIKKQTVLLGLGIDTDNNRWVLPVYDLIQDDYRLIGFEYRVLNFKNKKI